MSMETPLTTKLAMMPQQATDELEPPTKNNVSPPTFCTRPTPTTYSRVSRLARVWTNSTTDGDFDDYPTNLESLKTLVG